MRPDGLDQFGMLEEKVQSLISLVLSFREEKIATEKKLQNQNEKTDLLNDEIERLNGNRELARKKIATLLKKIESVNM